MSSSRIPQPIITKQATSGSFALDLSCWRLEQELKHSSDSSNMKPTPLWVLKNSRDGRFMASGSHDGSIKIWALVFDPLHPRTKNFGRQRSATVDDIKQRRRSSKYEHGQAIFDSNPLQIYSGHLGAISDLSWSHSHYFLLSASLDQTVRLWNISNTQCLCVFYHADIVSSVKFHPKEHHLFLSGSFDGRIRLWSILEKKVMHWNQVPNNSITAVEITVDGNTAIAGTLNGDLLFYELPSLKYDTEITITPPFRSLRLGQSRTQYKINGIESYIDHQSGENMMIISSTDSKIRIYQIRDKSLHKSFRGHICQTSLFRPNTSENGFILLSPSEDKSVCFWKDTVEYIESSVSSALVSKQQYMDRLTVDEQVLSAQFASSKIYYWKNSFTNALAKDSVVQADLNEPLILLISDVAGRICVYLNDVSSAALTVRSIKDVAISPQVLIQMRKKTSSPSIIPRTISTKATNSSILRVGSRETMPEIIVNPPDSSSIVSVEPRKQGSSSSLFNRQSSGNRLVASVNSQTGALSDLEEDSST